MSPLQLRERRALVASIADAPAQADLAPERLEIETTERALMGDALETLLAEGATRGRVLGLSVHPWLFGMAHRIRYLDEALAQVMSSPGIWHGTAGEVAAAWAAAQPA